MVGVVILKKQNKTYALYELSIIFSLSAGESCTDPSNIQQIQETASVFSPPTSDLILEVKSITVTLTEKHNISTLSKHCTTKGEGIWCSDQTFSTF